MNIILPSHDETKFNRSFLRRFIGAYMCIQTTDYLIWNVFRFSEKIRPSVSVNLAFFQMKWECQQYLQWEWMFLFLFHRYWSYWWSAGEAAVCLCLWAISGTRSKWWLHSCLISFTVRSDCAVACILVSIHIPHAKNTHVTITISKPIGILWFRIPHHRHLQLQFCKKRADYRNVRVTSSWYFEIGFRRFS